MKKIYHHIRFAGLVFLVIVVFSCKKDFLEVEPKGKLIASKTIDYDRLLNVAPNGNISFAPPMGDEMAADESYFSTAALRSQRLFRWDDDIYNPGQTAPEFSGHMTGLYLYNKIINEVMTSTGGTEQEKISIQAEAMAGRAFTYFWLINFYGKPYNAASSATDPGFPIITEADVTGNDFTRASVKEVYDFIVADLMAAIPNLPAQTTHRLRMSKAAAEGILGKVYMFMGKYNESLQQFNAAFADMISSSIPLGLFDYNVEMAPGGSFLPIGSFGPSYPFYFDNIENLLARQDINSWTFTSNEYIISPQTAALYDASDLRLKFFRNTKPGGQVYPSGMLIRRGPIASPFGSILPDLYLLRAESKARLNDLAGAKEDVEILRKHRMPDADATVSAAIASDRVALVKFILEERIREFAVFGFRWFDMRRLSVDPEFSTTVGTTHTVYSTTGSATATFTLKPERLVLRFPPLVMEQNPALQNNP